MINQDLANVPEEVQRRFRVFGGANNPNPKFIDAGLPVVPTFDIQGKQRERIMLLAQATTSVGLFTFQFIYVDDLLLWERFRQASYLEIQSISVTFTHGAGVNSWEFEAHTRYLSDEISPETTQVSLGQLVVPMVGTNHSTRYELLKYPKIIPINSQVYEDGNTVKGFTLTEIFGSAKREAGGSQTIQPAFTFIVDLVY